MGRRNNFARKFCAGFALLIMVMSVFSGAISATDMDTNSNNLAIGGSSKAKNMEFNEYDFLKATPSTKIDNGLSITSPGYGVDLKNQTKKVHVAISNSSGLGKFTMGGYYNGQWQTLLYGYPSYGSTSYLTIRVENATASVNYTNKNTMMDPYVVEPVHWIADDAVSMKWLLPDNITVEQNIRLIQDFARIAINATNKGSSTKKIGMRYYYDTMVAGSDNAPIYIPGMGVKTTEEEYVNPTFTYWKGYDHPTVPTVVSEAKISGDDATSPDKLQIDNYGGEQAWENYVSPGSSFSDSAVLTYWNPSTVAPGQSKQVVTYYGIGAPVAKGPFNVSEILVDRIDGNYCPEENATIKVDVISIGKTHEGSVKIDILDDGNVLYSSPVRPTGVVPADGATTVEFNWTVGIEACGKSLDIKASLLNSSTLSLIDEMTKSSMITVDPSCPGCAPSAYKFDIHVTPESVTTSIGGNETFKVEIYNLGLLAGGFTINVTGLPSDWFNLEKNDTFLTAGEYEIIDLNVHVPVSCDVSGSYQLNVSVTRSDTGEIKSDLSEIVVVSNPVISELLPSQGTRLGSCDVLFTWKTLVNSTTVVYLKSEDEPHYGVYLGDPGLYHAVTVYGLERNKQYNYYVMSNSTCGSSSSEVRTFFIDNGISFRQRTYSFSIERDYNQQIVVSVENTDSEPHDLLAAITNPYDDLYVGFVGDGSSDNIIPLNPGERKDIKLVVHAQDATEEDYILTMNITSTGATETLFDFANMHIHVHIPVINFSISEVSSDPVTLIKKFRVDNYGDTLTDFSVFADDGIKNNVLFQPSLNHYNLRSGTSIEFDVIPIFSSESQSQSTTCTICAVAGTSELSGNIHGKGGGVSKSAPANFKCAEGEQVRCVTLNNVGILRKMNDWYCTNRPDIDMKFDFPSGFASENVKKATLRINFNPQDYPEKVEPHDVDVYVNGHKVGSLSNTIPRGVYEFDINPSYLKYSSAGKANNKIELKTRHMNSGHYVISSDAVIHICVDNFKVCVCAPSQEEAINRAKKVSYLEPSLSSITVSISEPAEGQEVMKGKRVNIKAHVTGDGSSADDLAVTAYFSNGDNDVMLLSVGGGDYQGQWTVNNSGEPNTGECTITVRAVTCEASGEATRKVKIFSPDALKVEILDPQDGFCEQKDGEVVIKAKVNYYTSSTDEVGGIVKSDELDSIKAEIDGTTITLTDTGKGAGYADDGIYAGIWKPTKTKDYTIKVTAKKSGLTDGVDEVKGIVVSHILLNIPARFTNVHPYKRYVGALPQGHYENAPVFQRGVEKPQFEITGLTGVPSGYELRVVIEEPKGYGRYAMVKNLTISDGWTGDKVLGEWDYSTDSGKRDKKNIPIGIYKAQAQLVNISTKDIVQRSDTEEFYVIFDWDSTKKDFITNDYAYAFYNYPWYFGYGGKEYRLHIYDERIWKLALEEVTKKGKIDCTSKEDVTKKLFGNKAYINMKLPYPGEIHDYWWSGKNNLWYDNLKALDAKSGTCSDQSALSIGLLRAIGIPARMLIAFGNGGVGPNYKDLNHAFVEVWYDGNWHWFDPTNVAGRDAGTVGTNEYTKEGVQFRPEGVGLKNNGYWVITSNSVPGNTPPVNIYKRYNYNLDVVDMRFDKTSYKPGDTMNIEIDVKNTGYLTIPNPRLEVSRMTEEYYIAPGEEFINNVFQSQLADVDVANSLAPNQQVTKTVSDTAPYSTTWSSYHIIAKPYTLYNNQKAYTFTKTKNIPGYSITPIYSIDVDDVKKTFQRFNGTFFESNVSDEKAYIKDSHEWDGLPVNVELYSEINFGRNYSKTTVTIENPDSEPHVYNFSMPVYGFGDAAYVPAIGTITSNTTLNVEASHIIAYNQSSVEDTNVSVYEFSRDAKINAIEMFEHEGIKLVKADAYWNMTLPPGSSHEWTVYSSTRPANITAPSGDTCANATPLTLGVAAQDAIDPIGDVDWWKVEVPTTDCPQILNVTLDGPDDQDFDLYVYDSCDSEDYLCAPLEWDADETCWINATPGTYYIKIEGYGDSTGNYTLYTSITPNNDYCCGAILIPPGYYGAGWISPAGDIDWWKVNITGDGSLNVTLDGPDDQNFDLHLYDSCDVAEPLCAPLEPDADETCIIDVTPGMYYIKIDGYGDSTGYYEVRFSFSPSQAQSGVASSVSAFTFISEQGKNPYNKYKTESATSYIIANAGFNFSEIHTTFAKEIVDNGDSLLNLKINAPTGVRVGETIPINLTVFNNGIVEETMNLSLNVSRTPLYSRTPEIMYTNTTSILVSPNSGKTLTYPVYIPKNTSMGLWDINVDTDKGVGAKAVFAVEDAFDLNCIQNITVIQYSPFTFNATITNTWDTTVHDINITIDLFYSFNTSESVEKQIGNLLPGDSRTISWQLNATSSGELPIEVLVTSDDGGSDTVRTTITSLSPPVLWIPNIITRTSAPDIGTNKTVFLNVTIQNLGDLTANDVQVQLLLPENVTSTALTHDIGDLLGGEKKNVTIDLTFSMQKDFAFDVVAEDDAGHSAIGLIMISQYVFVTIFDTGEGTYPSIFGTHKGEIKPSCNITVSKLYTYPCLGTGGHTESIELEENGELIANGTWNGYQSDWHNITLHNVTGAPYVRLLKGHKYNYTIVTGSYPQIHHTDNHSTPTGFITCSEFVDANGKRYNNWIPAIKLFLQ